MASAPEADSKLRPILNFVCGPPGYRGPTPFTERAVAAIAGASEGLSRRINILADKVPPRGLFDRQPPHRTGTKWASRFATPASPPRPRRSVGWLAPTAVAAVGALARNVMHASGRLKPPCPGHRLQTRSRPRRPAVAAPAPPAADTPTGLSHPLGSPALAPDPQGLDRFSQWLASANSRHYFIQLYGAEIANAAEIEAFLRRSGNAVEGGQLRIYRSDLSGQDRLG